MTEAAMAQQEKFIKVDGLRTRILEQGSGAPVLFLHGAALGSSADVWTDNMPAFAQKGFRAIAPDLPGFGMTENPRDYSDAYTERFLGSLMDALELDRAHIIGHSLSGRIGLGFAFAHPHRVRKLVVLGTGSLLPPLPAAPKPAPAPAAATPAPKPAPKAPTPEDSRKLLEDNLFKHDLITPARVEMRHRMSTGKNFEASLAREQAPAPAPSKEAVPLWKRLGESSVPLLMIFGKQDRGSAGERAALAKQQNPALDIHVLDGCKHLVQWDCASEFEDLSLRFLSDR
jgi:pimeloyl-ACP methyl ester carboxylesterase